jgi:hypothetical protein
MGRRCTVSLPRLLLIFESKVDIYQEGMFIGWLSLIGTFRAVLNGKGPCNPFCQEKALSGSRPTSSETQKYQRSQVHETPF